MSVVDHRTVKVVLPRNGDALYQLLAQRFPNQDQRSWKYLAMLALRVDAGWTMEEIGRAFGHPKGHISRCLSHIKSQVRELYEVEPQLKRLVAEDDDAPA